MSFLGIIPMVSQTKFHHIWITKSKVIHVKSQYQNEKRQKTGKNFLDYKTGQ